MTSVEIPDTDQPWAATPTVVLARAVNAELDSVDDADGPWDRIQKRVTEEHKLLADAMARHGHSAGLTLSEGVIVIDVVFQGRSHDLPGLAEALAAEVEQRTTLLSAREREILENHLLNEVAGTLHELISGAEAEVRQMNDELESRPTSTGMKLRLIWQQARNAPEGLDRVRLKLRQTIDAWSAADRALVGTFLQQRIAAEHADNPAAGWAEALTSALDYRGWHEFVIQRYQDGHWRPATGPASGGERALVVSVPLFAAASSHYKSAGNPHAPRLIALDEAFAGVDDDSRAKCLGLLATFDMDVVMTSEREWGCYPQVPGLGISHLARQDGVDAVLVTPWRWDGRERRRADRAACDRQCDRHRGGRHQAAPPARRRAHRLAGPAGARPAGGRAPADRDRDPDRGDRRAAAGGRTADRQAAPFWHVAVGVAARGGPGPARERCRAGRTGRGRSASERSAPGPQPRPGGYGVRLGGRVRAAGRGRGGPHRASRLAGVARRNRRRAPPGPVP